MKNKTKFIISSLISLIMFSVFFIPNISFAQCVTTGGDASTVFCTEESAKTVSEDDCKQNDDLDKGLVQCGRKIQCEYQTKKNADGSFSRVTTKDKDGKDVPVITRIADKDDTCGFPDLINLIDRIIQYVLLFLAIPIAAIMFVYAGILLLFSGGDPGAKTKAKGIFFNAVIGLVIAFAAFLIIKLIFSILGYTGAGWIGFD